MPSGKIEDILEVSFPSGSPATSITFGDHNVTIVTPSISEVVGAREWSFDIVADSQPIPEPSTFFLFGVGVLGIGWCRQRRAA